MRLGLPSFGGLVERIYAALHESWHGHPAESEGMDPTGVFYRQYDRVLRQLEKRLEASDAPRNRGMRERFRKAIRAALVVPEQPDLSSHLDLIELSRDEEGAKRLLTTNFDTLFERAWANARTTKLPSHAGVSMPQPRVAGFAGIMHLHGRLADEQLGLIETDLVVTSAEFGDAYIRSGWASRYVYDLARTQTIVLVGYSADDPPVRYLLETLEADRTRYPDLHEVYAFGSCEVGQEALETARWKAKGVTTPILYHASGHDHSRLYDALSAWRQYAAEPTAWRRGKLKALFERDFSSLTSAEVASATALLRHGDASALLGELSPDPRWFEELVGKNVFTRGGTHPGRWFASRIDEPEMIRAASRIGLFDDQTRWFVRAEIREQKQLSPLRRQAWEALASPSRWSPQDRDDDWFRILPRLQEGDTGYEARSVVAKILTPRFHIERPYGLEVGDDAEERLGQLLHIDFKSAEYPDPVEVAQAWPDDKDGIIRLLTMLDRRLREALEQAEDVGFLAGYDRSNSDVPSVAAHEQNQYGSGFYPIVRVIADLWSKLAGSDATAARGLAEGYLRSEYRLQHRLGLFALHEPAAFPPDVASSTIRGLSDEKFWDRSEQVELMRLLAGRWSELPAKDRDQLEERLRRGPPLEMYPLDSFQSEGDWQAVSDRAIQDRLRRLKAAGLALTSKSEVVLVAISRRHPNWKNGGGDREDFAVWSESGNGPSGHPELLTGIGDDKLVAEAMELQRERYFEEGDIWRLIANADPHRALRGLAVEAAHGIWNVSAWRTLFTIAENSGDASLQAAFASEVVGMPDCSLGELVSHASSWLRTKWSTLPAEGATNPLALWDRLASLAYDPGAPEASTAAGDGEQLINEALNRPGGVLAWALLETLSSLKPKPSSGLPEVLRPRFDRLMAAGGRAGLLGRVMLAETLSWLHQVDAEWAYTNIVPRLMWSHAEAPLLWNAHAHGTPPRDAGLFNALKDAQLEAFQRRQLRDDELATLSDRFVSVGIWHRYGNNDDMLLEDGVIKRVLTIGPPASRKNASFTFWKIMGNTTFDELGQLGRWREKVGPYFSAVYPLDAALRSPATSRYLSHMALDSGEAFPEVVEAVRDLVVPYELYNLAHSLRLESRHSDLVKTQPLAFLRLASALINPKAFPVPPDLQTLLDDARTALPSVVDEPEYIRLSGLAKLGNA